MHPTRFIPPAPLAIRPSGFVRPSGAVPSVAQVANAQAILVWLGHLPRAMSSLTGARDAATAGAVSAFQRNYNEEQRNRNYRFQPRQLDVDGDLGPQTIQALANYNQAAANGGYGLGLTMAQIEAMGRRAAVGVGSGPAAVTNEIAVVAPTPSAPRPSAPAPAPAPQRQAASTFPTGPAIAVGVGAAVILAAVVYKRSRKGR